jgi:hypothetical protein
MTKDGALALMGIPPWGYDSLILSAYNYLNQSAILQALPDLKNLYTEPLPPLQMRAVYRLWCASHIMS